MSKQVFGGGYYGYPRVPCLLRIATPKRCAMPKLFRKKTKRDGWYIKKMYPHFDSPLPFEAADRLVKDSTKVASFPFHPFLSYDKKTRQYRGRDDRSVKKRPIKYAAHRDGHIYSYYAKELSRHYEAAIKPLGLDDNVIAYRKNKGNNVDFACVAFDEINRRGSCAALALDISGFFDSIDHENLKKEWSKIIGGGMLPPDHFAVFKALTKWAEVDRDKCYERLRIDTRNPPFPICDDKTFRSVVKGRGTEYDSLVTSNKNAYGIPQGTPMSALLSNIYMIPFDVEMKKLAEEVDCYYRRYSDDILWICPQEHVQLVLSAVDKLLSERGENLVRKEEKTDISIFSDTGEGGITCDKPFQYLGFTYNGNKRLIRSQTLARYWRRLIYATWSVKREARSAEKQGKAGKPFRRKLNHEMTHLGHGNFIRNYAYPAQEKMGGRAIRNQLKDHYLRVDAELAKKRRRRIKKAIKKDT